MKRIATRAKFMLLLMGFFIICLILLLGSAFKDGAAWAMHPANQNLFTEGTLKYESKIYDRDKTLLLKTSDGQLIYNDNPDIRRSTLHAVGESTGNIVTGVYTAKRNQLAGYDIVNGVFSFNNQGKDMTLTLDADVCAAAYNALGRLNGTVGIYNYKTGEVICMVSSPNYDPNDPPDFSGGFSEEYEGVYLNRLLSGLYAPGSVFKLIASAAAIENIPDINEQTFYCDGGIEIDGEWISCMGNHGEISFKSALSHSCNAAFSEIANELGRETLAKYVKEAGFTSNFEMDGIKSVAGRFNVDKASDTDLGWAGIGQYTDLANPCQMMIYAGAIANGGQPVRPYIIEKVGIIPKINLIKNGNRLLKSETADTLKSMMRNNVVEYYGDSNFENLGLCAKTGTAEVDDGESHAWFVGFLDNDEHPYAFVVVAEHGGNGLSVAGSIANTVLQAAVNAD